jgi:hypothetical protein
LTFILLGIRFIGWGIGAISHIGETYKFNQLTATEHLAQSNAACGNGR